MTDPRLPQAQFFELPAPPDGEAVAVRAGRGIRRRRRMLGTGAAALSMLLVAGVAVAAGTGSNHASDQLVPAGPDLPAPSALSSPSPTHAAKVAAGRPPATGDAADSAGAAPTGGPSPATAGDGTQPHRSDSTSDSGSRPSYVTPPLRRTFTPASPTGARVCGAHTTSTGTDVHGRLDWCVLVAATVTERGHDLGISVCRDQTGDSRLSFPTNQEVDLAVSRNGHVVWRWSTGHATSRQPHALTTPAGACWTWTAPWTDVDASGRPLARGSYTLTVTSRASEVADLPDETGTFRVT